MKKQAQWTEGTCQVVPTAKLRSSFYTACLFAKPPGTWFLAWEEPITKCRYLDMHPTNESPEWEPASLGIWPSKKLPLALLQLCFRERYQGLSHFPGNFPAETVLEIRSCRNLSWTAQGANSCQLPLPVWVAAAEWAWGKAPAGVSPDMDRPSR